MAWPLALAVALAWTIDALFGEPRDAWHPVAWLGRVLGPLGRRLRAWPAHAAFAGGALVWCGIASGLGITTWWLQTALVDAVGLWAAPMLALMLKPMFAWRMLRDEVAAVEAAQSHGLAAARARLSRDVQMLDARGVRESALETLAENLNDSVVAPLFWFAVAGLPGAVVYRFANTADAMWGYRGEWEWAGKWAARADDGLSWLPARLTAALLLPPARWAGLRHEARRIPSPNGGWPMGAMALRLNVRLTKPDVYALNAMAPAPEADDTRRALLHAGVAAWLAMAASVLVWTGRAAWTH
jgi:adenosylcobinamide-phosphate synthase